MKRSGEIRSEANRGGFLLAVLCFSMAVGWWAVPEYAPTAPADAPLKAVNGLAWRHDDAADVAYFLGSLRDHGGVLCLGTSETTGMPGGNWPDFLNAVEAKHAVMAGAGRTAGVYLPVLARHANEIKGLRVIYYINPVYWNVEHGPVNGTYWNRYVDASLLRGCDSLPAEIRRPIEDGWLALSFAERWNPSGWLRAGRKGWFKDVRRWIRPTEFTATFSAVDAWEAAVPTAPDSLFDPARGVHRDFHHAEWFKPVSREAAVIEARTAELTGFIAACGRWGIEATFVLGPYNAPFIRAHAADAEVDYAKLQAHLAQILDDRGVRWIDTRNIGHIPGAFRDHQHLSSFGAALIAQRILEHEVTP